MKDKERDIIDDLIRSKLYEFEADTSSGDWEAIANRLPRKASIPLYRKASFWAAAAVIALLMVMSGIYMWDNEPVNPQIAGEIQKQTEQIISDKAEKSNEIADIPQPGITEKKEMLLSDKSNKFRQGKDIIRDDKGVFPLVEEQERGDESTTRISDDERMISKAAGDDAKEEKGAAEDSPSLIGENDKVLIADAIPVKTENKTRNPRKWGFGMGAGSMSIGADNVVPSYVTNAMGLRSESLMMMNAASADSELPETDIKHKTPVSFGIGVSRYLNDRFALQTGLTYTYLSSEWKTNGNYSLKSKQSLHFLGIPLSLTYKIAEWNRFNFYASAGGMVEKNISGSIKSHLYSKDDELSRLKENRKMKELLWSVNARAGVSYPVIRFVSAFAEVGAGYYFDNGSDIETIHSEKPFNVSLQFGLRLGF